jgi:hypothetical protein
MFRARPDHEPSRKDCSGVLAVRPNLEFAHEVAIPAAACILGKVTGLDPTADVAMLPESELVAVETDRSQQGRLSGS